MSTLPICAGISLMPRWKPSMSYGNFLGGAFHFQSTFPVGRFEQTIKPLPWSIDPTKTFPLAMAGVE